MWSQVTDCVIFLVALWLTAKFISRVWSRRAQPAEPDDSADVPASLRPRPKHGAGAVALAEPDPDQDLIVHPRLTRRRRGR